MHQLKKRVLDMCPKCPAWQKKIAMLLDASNSVSKKRKNWALGNFIISETITNNTKKQGTPSIIWHVERLKFS